MKLQFLIVVFAFSMPAFALAQTGDVEGSVYQRIWSRKNTCVNRNPLQSAMMG